MALIKGTNAYASVEEADAYLADGLDSGWSALDPDTKAKALVSATRLLDTLNWKGYAMDETQPLGFPRVDMGTPTEVVKAAIRLAEYLAENGDTIDSGGVRSIKVGPIELDSIRPKSSIPSRIKNSLSQYIKNSGGSWWRAN